MKKTYFLAPNLDYPPSSNISLGRIWTDPSDPGTCINPDGPLPFPSNMQVQHGHKTDWKNKTGGQHKGLIGIWARFLQVVGIDAEANVTWHNSKGDTFEFMKLYTEFIDPTTEYYTQSVLEPSVADYIAETKFRKSIYMITGVKIARGADVKQESSKEAGTHLKAGIDGTTTAAPVAVGPEVTISSSKSETTSSKGSSDFVFAYRLREIYYSKGKFKHREHNKGALQDVGGSSTKGSTEDVSVIPPLEVLGLAGDDISGKGSAVSKELATDEDDGEECNIFTVVREAA